MARGVKTLSGLFDYVLDIEDNRSDPEPFYVVLEPLDGRELEQYERMTATFSRGNPNLALQIQKVRDEMIAKHVKEVHNYSIQVGDEVLVPRTGAELVQMIKRAPAGELDLVFGDIEEALKKHSKLEAGLRKK
jgi:hypothetical protein